MVVIRFAGPSRRQPVFSSFLALPVLISRVVMDGFVWLQMYCLLADKQKNMWWIYFYFLAPLVAYGNTH
jgi:hypothetical protein